MQVGDAPVFVGDGTEDIACRCGAAFLVRRYRPGTLLAIDITCATCGAVTTTPGLNADQVVPLGARMVTRTRTRAPESFTLAPGVVLGDQDELTRVDQLSAPRRIPATLFDLSAATLAELGGEYDRLTGGQLAAQRRVAAQPRDAAGAADGHEGWVRLPLAWSLGRLEALIATPDWPDHVREPDAAAAVQLGAFREFPLVWSQHPLFPAMTASAALAGFSTHALAVFAAARFLAGTGNRVAYSRPNHEGEPIDGFDLVTSPTERVPVVVRRFDRFDWPRGQGAEPATARAAMIDALIASQVRIKPRQPGILVLSVGVVRKDDDPILMQSLNQILQERGRRHRGLAAVALVLPKVHPTVRPDQVAFGWIFLPFANPHHAGSGIQFAAPPGGPAPVWATG